MHGVGESKKTQVESKKQETAAANEKSLKNLGFQVGKENTKGRDNEEAAPIDLSKGVVGQRTSSPEVGK